MVEFLQLLVVALIAAALVFGVAALATGSDAGLAPVEPDGVPRGLPGGRPLVEADLAALRFDTAVRGYRMAQVDQVISRVAYDLGFKIELLRVFEAEVAALRDGRADEAESLRRMRETAMQGAVPPPLPPVGGPDPIDIAAAEDEEGGEPVVVDGGNRWQGPDGDDDERFAPRP